MASTQGPKITKVDILVPPREHVTVNQPFKLPIMVGVNVSGPKTQVPVIDVVLCSAGDIELSTGTPPHGILRGILHDTPNGTRRINAVQAADPKGLSGLLPCEMKPPAQGSQFDEEYMFCYRIDGLSVSKLGNYFITVTCRVPMPTASQDNIRKNQITRNFKVHTAADFKKALEQDLSEKKKLAAEKEKLAAEVKLAVENEEFTAEDEELVAEREKLATDREKLAAEKEKYWLQRAGVDI